MSKIEVQQSTLCYHLIHNKYEQIYINKHLPRHNDIPSDFQKLKHGKQLALNY